MGTKLYTHKNFGGLFTIDFEGDRMTVNKVGEVAPIHRDFMELAGWEFPHTLNSEDIVFFKEVPE